MIAVDCQSTGGSASAVPTIGDQTRLECSLLPTQRSLPAWFRRFCGAPVTPRPLAWFRIGLASVLLVQALSLVGHLQDLFSRHGIVAWSVPSESSPPTVPSLAWLDTPLRSAGVSTAMVVPLAFSLYVGSLVGLLLGYRTRIAASIAWLAHTALITSGQLSAYGVDMFAQIGLFYCLWFPVGQALTLNKAANRVNAGPMFTAWLSFRVLQAHVCIIYTASGLEKACGEQWWNGEAIWRALMGAPLGSPIDCSILATIPWLAKGLCWLTLLLEAGAIAFVWHPRLRRVWLIGIVSMHLSIAFFMSLWTFSATMIVFDVIAFGMSPRENARGPAASQT